MNFDAESFKKSLSARLKRQYGKDITQANKHDLFDAVSASAMEIITENWMKTRNAYYKHQGRRVYYLSAEFLMGRALSNNLINAGIIEGVKDVLEELGVDYNMVEDQEPDAGLGNGGLGRLAACFLDSLATLDYPGHGYGIRYNTACSSSTLKTDIRLNTLITGSFTVIRGKLREVTLLSL